MKIVLIYNLIKKLRENSIDVCIYNYEKFLKFSNGKEILQKCDDRSYVIAFEVENKKELPIRYNLVTSITRLSSEFIEILEINKLSSNLYKAQNKSGQVFLFKIVDDQIVEESLRPIQENILELLKEFNGESDLSNLVSIISKKYNISRDAVRYEIAFLKDLGLIDVKNKKVILTQLL
ncbi:MAG: hypothetical protein QW232_05350 [Saccharolobus sp.]